MNGVLDFLSPVLASDEGDFHPVARSAVERLYSGAEATFEERDGWRVPVAVPGERDALRAVGVADLSHLGKLEARPSPEPVAASAPAEAAAPAAGAGETLQHSVTRLFTYRLSPRRSLLFFPEPARSEVVDGLRGTRLLLDVTAAYTVLALGGPSARQLVARLTHLHHFPSGGEVAHVTAHVLPAGSGFRVVVAQEHGYYLAEVALDCAQALGGGLIGVDALPEDERP